MSERLVPVMTYYNAYDVDETVTVCEMHDNCDDVSFPVGGVRQHVHQGVCQICQARAKKGEPPCPRATTSGVNS